MCVYLIVKYYLLLLILHTHTKFSVTCDDETDGFNATYNGWSSHISEEV